MNEIEETITKAQKACDSLVSLLNEEKKLLIEGNSHLLSHINGDKNDLLILLNEYEKELNTHINNTDLSTSNNNSTNNEEIKKYATQWDYLIESLSQCRLLNNRNGYIINMSLSNTHSSLALLRGQSQDKNETYSNNGISKQELSSRTIAKI